MLEEFFETSDDMYRRKRCDAIERIRQYKGREPTEKEIEEYLIS